MTMNNWKNDPLYRAVSRGDLEGVQRQITKGVNYDEYELSPLHYAIAYDRKEIFILLVNSGADISAKTKGMKQTPAHWAARSGHTEYLEVLTFEGADMTARDGTEYGHEPIHLAAMNNHTNCVEFLIRKNVHVDTASRAGMTPLFLAVQYSYPDMVFLLLQYHANVNYRTIYNVTPLHLAVMLKSKHKRFIVRVLMDYNADALAVCKLHYLSPLHLAVNSGDLHTLVDVTRTRDDLTIRTRDVTGNRPLHLAAIKGHLHIVEWLLAEGCFPDSINNFRETPIQFAVTHGHIAVVAALLNGGAVVNYVDQRYQATLLHLAMRGGNFDIVSLLLRRGANPNAEEKNLDTPMHIAAKMCRIDCLRKMVEYGGDFRVRENDIRGESLLVRAAKFDCREVARWLLDRGMRVNMKDVLGMTPLHYAAAQDSLSVAELLIERGADCAARAKHMNLMTPLHLAAFKGLREMTQLLCEHCLMYDAETSEGLSPMHFAAKFGHLGSLQVMAACGGNIAAAAFEGDGDFLLHSASANNQEQIVEWLLVQGVPVNARNKCGETPMNLAACRGHTSVVRILLEHHADVNVRNFPFKRTPLHCAVENGHFEVVKLLLEHKANPAVKDWVQLTPLKMVNKSNEKEMKEIFRAFNVDDSVTTVESCVGLT